MPSIIKKIAVFGGSGMTGLCVVEEALQRGLAVRLLLQPTSIFPPELQLKVEIVRGDVRDISAVKNTVAGCYGVAVALGTRNNLEETTMMSSGVKNIIEAMIEINIKPLTVCLSSFLLMPEEQVPTIFHPINREHKRMLDALECSSVDWIAVLPPHIADTPRSQYLVKEGALPGGRTVSKRDLAAFLIDGLSQQEYYHKKIAISSQ